MFVSGYGPIHPKRLVPIELHTRPEMLSLVILRQARQVLGDRRVSIQRIWAKALSTFFVGIKRSDITYTRS